MNDKKKIIVGISCGDINGIGFEIIIKAFLNSDLFSFCTPILYTPPTVINQYKKLYGEFHDFNYHVIKNAEQASSSQMNVIKSSDGTLNISPGIESKIGAEVALSSLDLATKDLKEKKINILLTLPVNKKNISTIETNFIGHTEYLAECFDSQDSLMLLCNENLRIATVTNHVPISHVSNSVKKRLIEKKIQILLKTLKIDFLISKPKIAVLGLNPHAGDNGLIGKEDLTIIKPIIETFFEKNNLVYGPYASDAFFGTGNYKNFDAILGMYHDQALIPFKLMSFGRGVNYTAGLPIIRVSPDHGVAYDIAGKGIASINSVLASIFLGIQLYSNRKLYLKTISKTSSM